ncbi:hypothetical protein AB0G04_34055 [Actinoplanes sp. NPDC023801]|uniref:hypothetical protein n=1 Tax=Actinoplanes sp. NPDC023801 TaxID=3154595 RepID=UPI003400324B
MLELRIHDDERVCAVVPEYHPRREKAHASVRDEWPVTPDERGQSSPGRQFQTLAVGQCVGEQGGLKILLVMQGGAEVGQVRAPVGVGPQPFAGADTGEHDGAAFMVNREVGPFRQGLHDGK